MPRYAYQKPRAKVYAYNYGYMSNYYKPMTHYLEREVTPMRETPGAQSLAERLKKFPMDGTVYPDSDGGRYPSVSPCRDMEPLMVAAYPASECCEYIPARVAAPMDEERMVLPLHLKHPYYLAVENENRPRYFDRIWYRHPWDWECIWVPPHENRSTPHFGVEAYRSLIDKFLRLKPISEITFI